MIRKPLRPLVRILKAREQGLDPNQIEAEERYRRYRFDKLKEKSRAQQRLVFLLIGFFGAFALVAVKMTILASTPPYKIPKAHLGNDIDNQRADIVDRNGAILATNLLTHSLYAHPEEMIDKKKVARGLAKLFPAYEYDELVTLFNDGRKFHWLEKKLSPEQQQAVKDLGEPGLQFGPRKVRLYPNGSFASHILGGTTFGRESVDSAEIIGEAGVELMFDEYLNSSENSEKPLVLSLDLSVQSVVEKVLAGGLKIMNARAGSAVLIEVYTGQILALASLPDFNPNNRPALPIKGDPSDSPLFNIAAQGLYELGSTFKVFTAAQAFDEDFALPSTMINTKTPLILSRKRINDFHYYGPELSLSDVIVKSSNVGTARVALAIGANSQKRFLQKLGLLDRTGIELPEARRALPIVPTRWSALSTATISYGHGISVSPVHLAAAYATLVNGGTRVSPTLIKSNEIKMGEQIVSAETSAIMRRILRQVVTKGTAKNANIRGYAIGGKTGTADKDDRINGGYLEDKVRTIFAATFPTEKPKYVLVVTLDEPEDRNKDKPDRTASATAVPVATEIVRRVAPILGVRPNKDSIFILPQSSIVTTNN